jgi:hypothetical protein
MYIVPKHFEEEEKTGISRIQLQRDLQERASKLSARSNLAPKF